MTLRILETIFKWQQLGEMQPVQHIALLPAYRIDSDLQSLKTNEQIEPLTIAVVDNLWKIETNARRRTLSLDMEAA